MASRKAVSSVTVKRALNDLDAELRGEGGIGVPRPTGKKCTACHKGNVVAKTEPVFDATTGPAIIGPGSRNQYNRVTSYYCEDCGVMYAFPPRQQ